MTGGEERGNGERCYAAGRRTEGAMSQAPKFVSRSPSGRQDILSVIILCFLLVSEEGNLVPIIFELLVFIPIAVSPKVHSPTRCTLHC